MSTSKSRSSPPISRYMSGVTRSRNRMENQLQKPGTTRQPKISPSV
jgi:hypothetical protein